MYNKLAGSQIPQTYRLCGVLVGRGMYRTLEWNWKEGGERRTNLNPESQNMASGTGNLVRSQSKQGIHEPKANPGRCPVINMPFPHALTH